MKRGTSEVRDPWWGRRILCDQSEPPRVADVRTSTLPALIVAVLALPSGKGFGSIDPLGVLLGVPFTEHLEEHLMRYLVFFLW